MSKNVIYFVPEFPRLTETFIEREISKLIERNNLNLIVFSLKQANGTTSSEVLKHTIYRRARVTDFLGVLRFSVPRLKEISSALPLVFNKFDLSVVKKIWIFVKSIGYAYIFSKYSPQHLHAHFLSEPSTIVMVASSMLGVPYSISGHARDVIVDGQFFKEKAKTAKFIAICNENACNYAKNIVGEYANKVSTIYHGVPDSADYVGSLEEKSSEKPLIFVGSRLVEKKGLRYVIEASKILRDRNINHEIHIVGPGPMYQELISYVNELGLSDNVFIPGEGNGVSHDEIKKYFRRAHIFAHPSIVGEKGDVDGVPTFVIEAAFAKLPIITTDVGSITDLVNKETGIIIPDKDSEAIATVIEKLILNPKIGVNLGNAAHIKAKKMFDIDSNVQELEMLLIGERS